ncbi:hypothetical protein Pmani_009357 [Petrolisthes manimaculis]|uniref:MARVEL domain-containing protein n=1 Tax=Petrolisthes manimaculis TaxID=1843537 RepID=A0AAE1UIG1_9EUCA|nr:hypothetical protein Pmani_009357 [Petrolisthes manimaculis]
MILFLVGNKCWSNWSYLVLYLMPCVVCSVLTLVSLGSGLMVVVGRRNPLTTHAWVKGDVWFNVMAFLVMLLGSLFTFTNRPCSDNSVTVAAIAMGFITTILFLVSAAVMYLKLRHFQEELKEARKPPQYNRRATISSIT